ncbi:MAG: hypothetical protein ACE5ET_00670 [Gammaproteobacteria bacterium]
MAQKTAAVSFQARQVSSIANNICFPPPWQNPGLRAHLDIANGAERLQRVLDASATLMKVMARACGHKHLGQFNCQDITSWKKEMAELAGIRFAGATSGAAKT